MPPRREDPELARLVSEQVLASLPNIVSQVAAGLNANPNNNQGSGERKCTYKSFRSCNPKEFHGTEGAVGLLTWLESMESVLHISKCTEEKKVEYATCLLQGRALTWWNTQVQTRGREVANGLTWEDFKKMMKEERINEYSSGEKVRATNVLRDCTLSLLGKDFSIDLIPIKIGSFDIIVGMD